MAGAGGVGLGGAEVWGLQGGADQLGPGGGACGPESASAGVRGHAGRHPGRSSLAGSRGLRGATGDWEAAEEGKPRRLEMLPTLLRLSSWRANPANFGRGSGSAPRSAEPPQPGNGNRTASRWLLRALVLRRPLPLRDSKWVGWKRGLLTSLVVTRGACPSAWTLTASVVQET